MDGAQNISTNANSARKDATSITLAPIAPPSVSTVLVGNSDTMNGAASERIIPAGQDVYIRWTASGTALSGNPVSIFFTSDDSNYNLIAGSLVNGNNGCDTLMGSGSAFSGATGCYKWANGSPSGAYYRIKVAVTNTSGGATFANSQPVNTAGMQILAGNTEAGIGSAAKNAFLSANLNIANQADRAAMVASRMAPYISAISIWGFFTSILKAESSNN